MDKMNNLQEFLDSIAHDLGIRAEFRRSSNHHHSCRCAACGEERNWVLPVNERENLGKEVKANYATGGTFDRGTIIAYCPRPTYIIERKDGSRFSWVADLCEIKEELGIDND